MCGDERLVSLGRKRMDSFCGLLQQDFADLLVQIRSHPFIAQTANGTLPDERFRRFTGQNYLRLREFERFLALLSSQAPEEVRDRFRRAMLKNHIDIEAYEELAARLEINLAQMRMSFWCHAAVCNLHAAATMRSFEEAITACYATDFALYEGWSHTKMVLAPSNKWRDFVDLWAGEGIRQWVESLGAMVDSIATAAVPSRLEQMKNSYRTALYYRLRFWDMALEDTDW
jgi:thiaminase (transcriptional activator TenA)